VTGETKQQNNAPSHIDKQTSYMWDLKAEIESELQKHQSSNDSDTVLYQDYKQSGESFNVANKIDFTGIVIAYPYYIYTMHKIFEDIAPHAIGSELYGQIGSLSTFVGFLCGVSFTAAAGMDIKELLSDQERENKIVMMSELYQHILNVLVMADLDPLKQAESKLNHLNKKIKDKKISINDQEKILGIIKRINNREIKLSDESITAEQKEAIDLIIAIEKQEKIIKAGSVRISIKINKEIRETQEALARIITVIGSKTALAASPEYDTKLSPEAREQHQKEINENIRTQLAYQEKIEFLEQLRTTVQTKTPSKAFAELSEKVDKQQHLMSRDIITTLHRPAFRSVNFDYKVFDRAQPVEGKIRVLELNDNGFTPAVDESGTSEASNGSSAKDKSAKYVFKDTGADVINNYGVPAARIRYKKLLELVAELVTLKVQGMNWDGKTVEDKQQAKIKLANEYLENTHLVGFFTKKDSETYVNYLFDEMSKKLDENKEKDPKRKEKEVKLGLAVQTKKKELKPYEDVFYNYTVVESTSHYSILIQLIARLLPYIEPAGQNGKYANWIAVGSRYLEGTPLENFFKQADNEPLPKHLQELFFQAKRQRRINLEQLKLDPVGAKNKTDITPNKTPTQDEKQKIHAQELMADIKRKRDEILFYENKYQLINPMAGEPIKVTQKAVESKESVKIEEKEISLISSSSSSSAPVSTIDTHDPDKEHLILAQSYDTQVGARVNRIGEEKDHLKNAIKHFIKTTFEANGADPDLLAESEKILNYKQNGINIFAEGRLNGIGKYLIALGHKYIVYPFQNEFFDSEKHNIFIRYSMGIVFYVAPYIAYKLLWTIANAPVLLETLEASVNELRMGIGNLNESTIVNVNDSWFDYLFKPVKKAILLAPFAVGKGFFGLCFWAAWPFAKNYNMRKAARILMWKPFADAVGVACDGLDPFYNWLCELQAELDSKEKLEWIDVLKYVGIFFGYLAVLIPYTIIQGLMLPIAFANWIITDILKPLLFCIPILSIVTGLIYTYLNQENHDLAAKQVDNVSHTVGTKFKIFAQRYFVQPWRDTWNWYGMAKSEIDKLQALNFYGKNATVGWLKLALFGKLIGTLIANFFIGIVNTAMGFLKQAPVLTFISFTASTLAGGLPFGLLLFGAEKSGEILALAMTFEPVNSTRDVYNNSMTEQYITAKHKLKSPVKDYRRFIRKFLVHKLAEKGIATLPDGTLTLDGIKAVNKGDLNYQIALTELETRTYELMPRMPMDFHDTLKHLQQIFNNGQVLTDNLIPSGGNPITLEAQKVEKQLRRVAWAEDCAEYASYISRGKELYKHDESKPVENMEAVAIAVPQTYIIDATIKNNSRDEYKAHLAGLLAKIFNTSHANYDLHLEYFQENKNLDTIIDYFEEQYKIHPNVAGLSEQYNRDCKYAFAGFAELVTRRFIQTAAEERYRRSLDKNPTRFFYANQNDKGAVIPCSHGIDENGHLILTFHLKDDTKKEVKFAPKNTIEEAKSASALVHDRYDVVKNSENNDINTANFFYAENNRPLDLNLTMDALAKDFDSVAKDNNQTIEQPKMESSDNTASSSSSSSAPESKPIANSSSTRVPLTNLRRYGDTASSHHLDKANKAAPKARFNVGTAKADAEYVNNMNEIEDVAQPKEIKKGDKEFQPLPKPNKMGQEMKRLGSLGQEMIRIGRW